MDDVENGEVRSMLTSTTTTPHRDIVAAIIY